MKPLRILVVANLPPYVLGGAENQVARLVESWAGYGHHVEVAGHRIPDGVVNLGSSRITMHRIRIIDWAGRAGRALFYFFSMARLLRSIGRNFDIMYCRGLGDGALSICILKAVGWVQIPLIACPINAKGDGDTNFIRSILCWRELVSLINQHCNAINIIAPAIEPDLLELGVNRVRLSRIPNGIPLGKPAHRSMVAPIRRLVWVGRLSPQKGVDVLLDALARVVASGRDFSLELIGDGPEMPSLIRQCHSLGLESKVRFSGAIPKEQIRGRLMDADVFVLPSRYEGMSNAALEAMEAGLPLLLTRCGGLDTYVDVHAGLVCEPEDGDGLTNALLALLDMPDNELLEMGKHARRIVEDNFEIGIIGLRNLELMSQLLISAGKI